MANQASADWNELFIGRDQELQHLKRIWTEAKSGEPRFCVLRGESGFGKTKIIQKFYSEISTSALDDPNHYWPDTLLKEQNNLRVNPRASDFARTNTDIPWLWWGLRWTQPEDRNQGETQSCGLLANLDHLKPHQNALAAAEQATARLGKVLAEGATFAGDAVSFGAVSILKALFTLGETVKEQRQSQQWQQLSIEEKQQLAIEQKLAQLMEFFLQVLSNKTHLPIILILDDAQWMDTDSLRFIQQLMQTALAKNLNLLIIATHWEQEWNLHQLQATADKLPQLHQQLLSLNADCVSLCDIDRLAGLESLVKRVFSGLSQAQLDFLCQRADGNPRLLHEILLELIDEPYYFQQQDQQQALTEEAMQEMHSKSFKLHAVQTRRFRRMSQALQTLLSYASYQGMRFIKELVLELAEQLDQQQENDPAHTLASAIHPYATLIESSAVIYEFRHRVFYDLAKARIDLFTALENSISTGLIQIGENWLAQQKQTQLSTDESEAFYLLMLKVLEKHPDKHLLKQQLLTELLVLYQAQGYFSKALPWLDALANCFESATDSAVNLDFWTQIELIRLLHELNQWQTADRISTALLDQCQANLAASATQEEQQRELTVIQTLLADSYRNQDYSDKALALYQASLTTREQILARYGETAERLRDVSVSQNNVGDLLKAQDQPEQALALYQTSLTTREQILARYGETAERLRDVSLSQANVGDILRAQDQPEQALALYQASLTTAEQILARYGETAERLRDVSLSQNKVGDLLKAQDQPEQALALYQASLTTAEQIMARYGETAEHLRDIFVSCCRCAACYTEGSLQQLDFLNKAAVINQKKLLTYPQYSHQTRPEQQIILDVYKRASLHSADSFHCQQVQSLEAQLADCSRSDP